MLGKTFKLLAGLVTGPFAKIAKAYVESRENVEKARIEASVRKDVLTQDLKRALLEDAQARDVVVAQMIQEDRKRSETSWIRPVTIGMSLVFWSALVLSQARWIGYEKSNQLLPIIWDMPSGQYGELLFYLPMGVIGTFVLARPLEKIWGKK